MSKLTYLEETKEQIKNALNTKFNSQIQDNDTFRSYVSKINNIYANWPKITDEGTELSLAPTRKGKMLLNLEGNTYQETTTGKNSANFIDSQAYYYSNGVPTTINGASVISNKTNNSYTIKYGNNNFTGVVSNPMKFEENTDYVFSFNRPYNSNFTQRMHILQVNNDNSYNMLQAINAGAYGTPYTYTYSNTTAKKVAFMISTNNSSPKDEIETISEIMVRKSTDSDTFEPFTNGPSPNPSYPQPIEVVTGENDITVYKENLFNGEMELDMIDYDTGLNTQNDNRARTKGYIPLFSNTFSIIREEAFSSGQTIGLRFYDSNFNYIGRNAINNFTNYATKSVDNSLDTTKSVAYMRFILTTTNDMSKKFCVVNGESTTFDSTIPQTYPINLGNIELCKIENYQDEIYKQNNKWYLKKYIGKNIFNSINVFGVNGNSSGPTTQSANGTYSILKNNISSYIDNNTMYFPVAKYEYNSNVIDNITAQNNLNDNTICMRQNTNDRIYFKNSLFTGKTGNEISSLIDGMTFYFIRTSPITTEITDSILLAQLDTLEKAHSYNNQTNIVQSNYSMPFILNANALQKKS